MAVISSSTSNSSKFLLYSCLRFPVSINISSAALVMRTILTMPLCILILYMAYQQWRRQRCFKTTSHYDFLNYNVAVINLIWALGCFFNLCGTYANLPDLVIASICIINLVFHGEILFHILTCVERYLAVVHPVVYLRLKNVHGARIRNISIMCVWLLAVGWMAITALYLPEIPMALFLSNMVVSLVVMSFCSLSVLCVLIRPRPGDGGGEKEQVHQSKQRAFNTITAITGMLWLWFGGYLVFVCLSLSTLLSLNVNCTVLSFIFWCNLPSSLVSPVLYLHRAGKLWCC